MEQRDTIGTESETRRGTRPFHAQFEALRPQLLSYLYRLTANRPDAEDLAQDTFLRASRAYAGFSGRSSLKTWVFAIATNLVRDHHRAQRRWREDTQDLCRSTTQASPEKVRRMRELVEASPSHRYDFSEHISYCFTCIGKTLHVDQVVVLMLKDVYGFTIRETVEITGLTEGVVKHTLAASRKTMAEIFDRRCSLINKEGTCYQCSEMNGFFNAKHTERMQEVWLRMTEEAENGAANDHLLRLRLELVRSIDPLHAPGVDLHAYLLHLMDEESRRNPQEVTADPGLQTPRRVESTAPRLQ